MQQGAEKNSSILGFFGFCGEKNNKEIHAFFLGFSGLCDAVRSTTTTTTTIHSAYCRWWQVCVIHIIKCIVSSPITLGLIITNHHNLPLIIKILVLLFIFVYLNNWQFSVLTIVATVFNIRQWNKLLPLFHIFSHHYIKFQWRWNASTHSNSGRLSK